MHLSNRSGILALLSFALSVNAVPQTFTDLTNRFAGTKSGRVLNRTTNTFNSVVTVTNAGQTVTVFFQQGDNGKGNSEQVNLDNIWFH